MKNLFIYREKAPLRPPEGSQQAKEEDRPNSVLLQDKIQPQGDQQLRISAEPV